MREPAGDRLFRGAGIESGLHRRRHTESVRFAHTLVTLYNCAYMTGVWLSVERWLLIVGHWRRAGVLILLQMIVRVSLVRFLFGDRARNSG